VEFEPTISAGERPQNYALDGAATGTGRIALYGSIFETETSRMRSKPASHFTVTFGHSCVT